MATPGVTIIVPAYNAAAWLAQTLASIERQTFGDWQAFVADDASTDDTARIVAEFAARDGRFCHVRLPANSGGPATPRNTAIAQTRSDWLAFCDADDLWHPQKLETQLRVARDSEADLVCTAIRDFSQTHDPLADRPLPAGQSPPVERVTLWRLLGKNVIPNSSVMCRRELIVREGGFDTARELVAVEDYDLWLRLLEGGARIVKIGLPLVHYRRLPGSLSARKLQLARRVLGVLRRHFVRRRRTWLFPLAAPCLMTSYALQALYLRLWRGRL